MKLLNASVFHKLGVGLALIGIFSFGAVVAQQAPSAPHSSAAQMRVADGQETHGKNEPGGKGGRRIA